MPGFNKHFLIGMGAGAAITVVYFIVKKWEDPTTQFDWLKLARNTSIGGVAASIPDWIEPATNPNHRNIFHSLGMAILTAYTAFGKPSSNLDPALRELLQVGAVGYLSHLGADSSTPKGLPLV